MGEILGGMGGGYLAGIMLNPLTASAIIIIGGGVAFSLGFSEIAKLAIDHFWSDQK